MPLSPSRPTWRTPAPTTTRLTRRRVRISKAVYFRKRPSRLRSSSKKSVTATSKLKLPILALVRTSTSIIQITRPFARAWQRFARIVPLLSRKVSRSAFSVRIRRGKRIRGSTCVMRTLAPAAITHRACRQRLTSI